MRSAETRSCTATRRSHARTAPWKSPSSEDSPASADQRRSSLSYDWGNGVIAVMDDESSRYVIRRHDAAAEGGGDTTGESRR